MSKCCKLDIVPVLIARRIPFVTFMLFNQCDVIVHQTYNQLYPMADYELAEKAKDKKLLGYHDIRLGSAPDKRLLHFIHENLPALIPQARERFDEHKDLLSAYADDDISYPEFVSHLKQGTVPGTEDFELPPDEYYL